MRRWVRHEVRRASHVRTTTKTTNANTCVPWVQEVQQYLAFCGGALAFLDFLDLVTVVLASDLVVRAAVVFLHITGHSILTCKNKS